MFCAAHTCNKNKTKSRTKTKTKQTQIAKREKKNYSRDDIHFYSNVIKA